MLYYMCKKSKLPPTNAQLEHAIKRNFGGLESEKLHPYQEFFKRLPKADTVTIMEKVYLEPGKVFRVAMNILKTLTACICDFLGDC